MDKQIRYIPDYTAADNSNLVRDETHKLANRRFKCMTLTHGSFYADSLIIFKDGTKPNEEPYLLVHNKDYVYSDIDAEESTKAGSTVANVIIILNRRLGRKFRVTYRTVGLPIGTVNESSVRLLEAPEPTEISDSYIDIPNPPEEVSPTFHYHSLTKIEQFQYLLYYLEKIRNALLMNVTSPIRQYMTSVELVVQSLGEKSLNTFEAQLIINFREFKKTFDAKSFGVDRINNWGLMSEQSSDLIARQQFVKTEKESYLAMSAFLKFKNTLYECYLGSDYTQLGRVNGMFFTPLLATVADAMIGATLMFDTYNTVVASGVKFDRLAYPNIKNKNTTWSIRKITNSSDMKSSVVVATEVMRRRVYTGTIIKSDSGYLAEWKELIKPNDIDKTMKDIMAHMANKNNPHREDASSVGRERVENLPPMSDFDVITDSSDRKYVTWDMLDKYTRRFLLKNRPHKEAQLETADENLMRNISVVFSPCGTPCGEHECKILDQIKPITTTTTTTPAPVENHVGFFMEDYTNQQSVEARQTFSLGNYNGSGDLYTVKDRHPTYYNPDGSPYTGDGDYNPDSAVGQNWKHFNAHVNMFAVLENGNNDGNDLSVSEYYAQNSQDYKFLFRILPSERPVEEPYYFRMTWEIIGEYDEFEVPWGEDNEQRLSLLKCQNFGKYKPVSIKEGDLNNPSGPFLGDFMNIGMAARQLYDFVNYDQVPTDIGEISIQPQYFLEFNKGTGKVATPVHEQHAGWNIESRKGLARRVRMHIHHVGKDQNTNGDPIDKGIMASVEFTLATYMFKVPVMNWATEQQDFEFHAIYAMLNIVQVGMPHDIQHEYCDPKNHDQV